MEDYDKKQQNGVYSKVIRAGRRRTYFFDVRTTKTEEYYLTITESKKRFENDGYERHKVHVYKEDFHKFINAIEDVVSEIKRLMPDYDYDEFTRPVQTIEYDSDGNPIREELEETNEAGLSTEKEPEPEENVAESVSEAEGADAPLDDEDLKWD